MAKKTPQVAHLKSVPMTDNEEFLRGVTAARRMDGWINGITGMGTDRDARKYSRVDWKPITEQDAEIMYAGEAMAAKVVDLPVEAALEKGYEITGYTKEEQTKLSEMAKARKLDECLKEAGCTSRLHGGAGLFKVYDDDLRIGLPRQPGMPIKRFIVFNKYELQANYEDLERSMLSANFGMPRFYTLQPRGTHNDINNQLVKIHASRICRFEGAPVPQTLKSMCGYWGDSVLTKCEEAIRNYADAHNSGSSAAKDMSVGVFKIKGLADIVNAEQEGMLLKRMQMVNITKANARSIVIDADGEEFQFQNRNLTGASDLINKAEARLSADAGIPRTILYGEQSAGGLGAGASGDHSSENWYNRVGNYQQGDLKPVMLEIYREFAVEIGLDPAKLDIVFNPLWSMSDKEEVEMRSKQASIDKLYVEMGVLDVMEVRKSRFGGDKYSIETAVDDIDAIPLQPGAGLGGFGGSPTLPAPEPASPVVPAFAGKMDGGPGSGPRPGKGGKKAGKKGSEGSSEPDKDEARAIRYYTGSQSGAFIDADRGLLKLTPEMEGANKRLNNYLEKSEKFEGDIHRGISVEKGDVASVLAKYQPGASVELDAKQSWTKDIKNVDNRLIQVANSQKNPVKIKMEFPGSKVGVDVSKHSAFEEESEVLMGKGSRYTVQSVTKEAGGYKIIFGNPKNDHMDGGPGSGPNEGDGSGASEKKGEMSSRASNGQIKVKTPKTMDEAKTLLKEVGDYQAQAVADFQKNPNDIKTALRMQHANAQMTRAINQSKKLVPR